MESQGSEIPLILSINWDEQIGNEFITFQRTETGDLRLSITTETRQYDYTFEKIGPDDMLRSVKLIQFSSFENGVLLIEYDKGSAGTTTIHTEWQTLLFGLYDDQIIKVLNFISFMREYNSEKDMSFSWSLNDHQELFFQLSNNAPE